MTNVLNRQTTMPVLQYRHNWREVSNTAYAINAVRSAVNKGVFDIHLDPKKLKTKEYTSTEVFLYDRNGERLKKAIDFVYADSNKHFDYDEELDIRYMIISGKSCPQHGDKFSKAEGRKYALIDALNQLKFKSGDPNYQDLLDLKLFLQQFEIRAKTKYPHWDWPNTLITWEYIDLWNALLSAKSLVNNGITVDSSNLANVSIALVGQTNYDNLFDQYVSELVDFFCNGKEFNKKHKEETIEAAYYFYNKAIEQYNDDLQYVSIQLADPQLFSDLEELKTDDLVEQLQDTLQG